jgi:serine/threonine protein kinase
VWRGKWNGDQVAVKVFLSMHESSWSRETEIYQTCMLRHENILGYIASDIKGNGFSVNMLLITEYHSIGSLYDYLKANVIDDKSILIKFLYTISNGLHHLHQEIFGTRYKPSIAHRDLKTKNILIKNNFECCIGDFGLAVRFNSQTNKMECETSPNTFIKIREGSIRYMAPECLNETLDVNCIDDLKRTDIYSYSLVIWELLSRFRLNSAKDTVVLEHQPPFYEYVSGDPNLDLMKTIVCLKKIRPPIPLDLDADNVSKNLRV